MKKLTPMSPYTFRAYNLVEDRSIAPDDKQLIYQFENFPRYGVSIVRSSHSYGGRDGLWEMALIRFHRNMYGDIETTEWYLVTAVHPKGYLKSIETFDILLRMSEGDLSDFHIEADKVMAHDMDFVTVPAI
jgi:hypothetical protein